MNESVGSWAIPQVCLYITAVNVDEFANAAMGGKINSLY